ncbi:hypothetical protein Tb927.4.5330 [Trypanosoma brucei brucei TREU927]|uniref:T. brucei spp.-specific protein n=1 Tax=Trypanosoma brucei brucei (strain 927/4 GUTat10.1) TaxID=185431 RepID=Q580Q2_TRYB2|nr:hypothetical protein Tb927.4.5330 [Trypanosoma brucei brucei TREU927]AAX79132.1 hypothetical protein Tb927.4.5330 [Trypanosoma brucei]AAZ11122.1 hypothetical protein Tb927.4.5330 [Trypanosoma brucei brucei TREU927]
MKGPLSRAALRILREKESSAPSQDEEDMDYNQDSVFFSIPSPLRAHEAVRYTKPIRIAPQKSAKFNHTVAREFGDGRVPHLSRFAGDCKAKRERRADNEGEVHAAMTPRRHAFFVANKRDVPSPPRTTRELLNTPMGKQSPRQEFVGSSAATGHANLLAAAVAAVSSATGNNHITPRFTGDALILGSPRQTRAALLRREYTAKTTRDRALEAFAQPVDRFLESNKHPSIDTNLKADVITKSESIQTCQRESRGAVMVRPESVPTPIQPMRQSPASMTLAPTSSISRGSLLLTNVRSAIERNRECDDKKKVSLSAMRSPRAASPSAGVKSPARRRDNGIAWCAGGKLPSTEPHRLGSFCGNSQYRSSEQSFVMKKNMDHAAAGPPLTSRRQKANVPFGREISDWCPEDPEFAYEKCTLRWNAGCDIFGASSRGCSAPQPQVRAGQTYFGHASVEESGSSQFDVVEISDIIGTEEVTREDQANIDKKQMMEICENPLPSPPRERRPAASGDVRYDDHRKVLDSATQTDNTEGRMCQGLFLLSQPILNREKTNCGGDNDTSYLKPMSGKGVEMDPLVKAAELASNMSHFVENLHETIVGDVLGSVPSDAVTGDSMLTARSFKTCLEQEEDDSQAPFLRTQTLPMGPRNSPRTPSGGTSVDGKIPSERGSQLVEKNDDIFLEPLHSPQVWPSSTAQRWGKNVSIPLKRSVRCDEERLGTGGGHPTPTAFAALLNRVHLEFLRRYFRTWKEFVKRHTTQIAPSIRYVNAANSPIACKPLNNRCINRMMAAATCCKKQQLGAVQNATFKANGLTVDRLRLHARNSLQAAEKSNDFRYSKPLENTRSHRRMGPLDRDGNGSPGSHHRSLCSAETSFSCPSDSVRALVSMM